MHQWNVRRTRRWAWLGFVCLLAAVMPAPAASAASLADGFDFDGDRRADLAIGVPGEAVGDVDGAGAVNVVYGSNSGLTAAGNQIWHQDSDGVKGGAEELDGFGAALAGGDFDSDGFDDLAIGVSGESVDGSLQEGAVNVLYGSASGLSPAGDQLWHRASPGIPGDPGFDGEFFGAALAAADFDGDGFEDLAIGIPQDEVGSAIETGSVQILYGSASGLTATGNQLLTQDSPGIKGTSETSDFFGQALAAGHLDGDPIADLVIGVPREAVGGADDAGAVHVVFGSSSGLTGNGDQVWTEDNAIGGTPEDVDHFGAAVATGDVNGDFRDDLLIGVPLQDVGSAADAGAVHVLLSGADGPVATGSLLLTQDTAGVHGVSEPGDTFGTALAAGDVDGDQRDDVAIGAPGEDVGAIDGAGAVSFLFGSFGGVTTGGDAIWHQDTDGVADEAEAGDAFGSALAFGTFDPSAFASLAIGVPNEGVGAATGAGAVDILDGAGDGLFGLGEIRHQDRPNMHGVAEQPDQFGFAFAG
jgi:hypothetical protein